MEIFKLFGSIFVNTDDAEKSISKTTEKTESFGQKLASGIGTAAKWGAAIAAGATAGAVAIFKVAENSAKTADEIDKMSQKIGVSRQAYQELDFICSQSGTDVSTLQAGMKSLTAAMDKASEGTAANVEQFEKLGISVIDSEGNLRSQEDVMWETMEALQNMDNETEKARLATELFGRSGTELMPLLNGASGSIDEMKQQAHDLGLIINDETIDSGVKLTDTIDQTKRAFTAIATNIGSKFIPIVQSALEKIQEWLPSLETLIAQARDQAQPIIEALGTAFDALKDFLAPVIEKFNNYVTSGKLASDLSSALNTAVLILKGTFSVLSTTINTCVGWFKSIKEWMDSNKTAVDLLTVAIGTITAAVIAFNVQQAIANAGGIAEVATLGLETVALGVTTAATTVATAATTAFSTALAFLTSPVTLVIAAIGALIAIVVLLVKNWDTVKEAGQKCWEGIKGAFEKAATWFNDNVVTPISSFFSGLWDNLKAGASGAWEGIKGVFATVGTFFSDTFSAAWAAVVDVFSTGGEIFTNIKDGVTTAFKTIVNGLISGINSVIAVPFNGINSALRAIKNVNIAGAKPFSGLISTIDIPSIPQLYRGGVLEEGEVGLLEGNGAEAVVPLDQNKKWISAVAEDMKNIQGGVSEDKIDKLISVMENFMSAMPDMMADAMTTVSVNLDKREMGRFVKAVV